MNDGNKFERVNNIYLINHRKNQSFLPQEHNYNEAWQHIHIPHFNCICYLVCLVIMLGKELSSPKYCIIYHLSPRE